MRIRRVYLKQKLFLLSLKNHKYLLVEQCFWCSFQSPLLWSHTCHYIWTPGTCTASFWVTKNGFLRKNGAHGLLEALFKYTLEYFLRILHYCSLLVTWAFIKSIMVAIVSLSQNSYGCVVRTWKQPLWRGALQAQRWSYHVRPLPRVNF